MVITNGKPVHYNEMAIPTVFFDSQPPGPTTDKSVAYLSRAVSDTGAKPTVAELNG